MILQLNAQPFQVQKLGRPTQLLRPPKFRRPQNMIFVICNANQTRQLAMPHKFLHLNLGETGINARSEDYDRQCKAGKRW